MAFLIAPAGWRASLYFIPALTNTKYPINTAASRYVRCADSWENRSGMLRFEFLPPS
jgi:hypothetical protein